eukprot:GFUD01008408.1.p1 GENE.GFUD01008408.1~~GFUD01008408.1.p1  ORF type:complete len:332 (-),score=86.07 GFUD01008408.1:2-997(-)
MGSEKFCLRWNDFETNISAAFRELREDKDFFDVTIACDDEQIQAHKVILSACSPFFRNVLRRNPHQHPLLYLKGVKFTDLQSVLNFMYHGEVNVAQEELNSFLTVAEDLRVKGLTQSNSESQTLPPTSKTEHKAPDHNQPTKRPRPTPPSLPKPPLVSRPLISRNQMQEDIEEVPIKAEPKESYQPVGTTLATTTVQEQSLATYQEEEEAVYEDYTQYDEGQYEADNSFIPSTQDMQRPSNFAEPEYADNINIKSPEDLYVYCTKEVGESKWKCGICYQFSHMGRNQVRNHVESKHFPNTWQYNCKHCGSVSNTKKALDVHISVKHKNVHL